MALVDTQEVKLAINAETAGTADVIALSRQVEALAVDAGDAAPAFEALAQEILQLGQRKLSIDGLQAAISSAKSAHAAMRDARSEVQSLDKALADAKGAGANRDVIRLLEKELAAANRQLATAEKAWASQNAALKTARSESAGAGVDVKALGSAQQELAATLDATTARVNAQVEAVRRTREAEQARAAQAREQAAEEDRLAAIVAASKAKMAQAAQQQLEAEKRAYAEADAAARRHAEQNRAIASSVQNAFATLGIRSSDKIKAEILAINQALQKLATDGKTSAEDLARAWDVGQKRIAALNAEMGKGADPFTDSVGRATGGINTLMTRLAPVAGAVAAAFSVDRIARAVVEFDSLNRSLRAITGSSAAAQRELAYITDASRRLGLEIGSASKAYAQFLAVTKGTSLEGDKARAVFEAVAGSMAKLGKSSADTDGALLALSQMVSKGTVSLEELRQQLAERLPGAMQAAARGVGLTEAELIKMVESGEVLAEDLLPALAAQLEKMYGSADVSGYAASWNRLTSAVFEAAGTVGQMSAVSDTANGAMWVLTKTVQALGAAAVDVVGGMQMIGSTIGAVAGAITTGNWADIGSFLADEAAEIADAQKKSRDAFDGTADAANKAGAAARSAADQALQGNPGWLAVANGYRQVSAAVEGYVKTAQQALDARKAEAAAINQYAGAAGTEAERRQAEADGALAVAAATEQLAQVKSTQLAVMQAELAVKEQVVAADGTESAAKRKLIDDLKQKIELARQDVAQSAAAAEQARLEAAARSAMAQTVRDHSAELDNLRAAHERASAAVQALAEDERAGIATTEAVIAAKARAIEAATLYRDAVADNLRVIEAQSRAEQAAMSVEERLAQLKLAGIRTAEKSALASGNETAAAWRAVEAKRQEARMAELKARAQQAEARAQLEKIEAQERELSATDRLDKAKLAELEAAKAAATAKEIEGQISAELAKQLHAEADAAIRAMNAKAGTAEAGEAAGDAAEGASIQINNFNAAAQTGASIGAVFAKVWMDAVQSIRDVSPAAADALSQIQETSLGFWDFSGRVRGLGQSAASLVADNPLGDLQQQLKEVEGAAAEATAKLEVMDNINHKFNMGLSFAGWREGLAAMKELELKLLDARKAQIELSIEVESFNQAVERGAYGLQGQASMLSDLVYRAEELGSQELSGLRSALQSVRQEMQAIKDASRDTLAAVSDELDEINGNYAEIERRAAEARRLDVQAQLDEAKAAGNSEAVANLNAALQKLAQVEQRRVADAVAREREAAQKAADQAAKSATAATPTAAMPSAAAAPAMQPTAVGQTRTYRVDLAINGKSAGVVAVNSERDATTLTNVLEQLAEQARRAG